MRDGDAVGLMLPNVPEFAIAYYGILRAGGVVVPMNVLLKQREVAFYLTDPAARFFFAWHECADAARAGAEAGGRGVHRGRAGSAGREPCRGPGGRGGPEGRATTRP